MMRKLRQWTAVLCVAAAAMLTACGIVGRNSQSSGNSFYSDSQIMVVLATERNRYRDLYTDQIWQIEIDDRGTTFQTYLLNEVENFMRTLRTMNLLADQEDVRLTGQEKEQMSELAEEYYGMLTSADRKYIGAGKNEITDLYQQYERANKLVDELTKDVNLEISDSDARIIEVQEIVLDDEEIAGRLHTIAQADIVEFSSLAHTYSRYEDVDRYVGRGETGPAYEEAVFGLGTGDISEVFEEDGFYWIVKVVNDYDEQATRERKERLVLQRRNQAFREIYDSFEAENPVEVTGKVWNTRTLEKGEDSTTTNFFSLYREFKNP